MNRHPSRRVSLASVVIAICVLVATTPLLAAAKPWPGKPPIASNGTTPLQSAIQKANLENAKKKKDKLGPGEKKDKCAAALHSGDASDIAKWCDVAKASLTKLGEQDFKHPDGKSAGKRTVTKTVLEFETPDQKGRPGAASIDKWPATKLKAFERKTAHSPGPASGHTLGSSILPSPADNDDRDCIDWITGARFGGVGVADGAAKSCFDTAGALKATLSTGATSGTCKHTGGSIFFGNATDDVEDDCWDEKNVLKTTLVESIDEDGPESLDNDGDGEVSEDPPNGVNDDQDCISLDGKIFRGSVCTNGKGEFGEAYVALIDEDGPDSIDNDGDGKTNEDAPAEHTEDECQRLYRKAGLVPMASDKDADGQCDIGRALVKFVNDEAVKRPNGKKLFKAKDDGTPDSFASDGVEPGKESRRITLTESFGVKCNAGTTFVDGVCVEDADLAAMGGEQAFHNVMVTTIGKTTADGDDPDLSRVAMMGFTFAPPVIEWGYRINEDVCVLGICVEVFYARIGYEFDLAVGLRLPVEIEVLDQPASVLAGQDVTLQTQVEPLDFKSSEFESFCNEHDLDDGLIISDCHRFGFPDFLDASLPVISDAKKDGDEFVARYTVFAGVSVRILGIPLISWGLDSSLDVPAACTMTRLLQALKDLPDGVDVSQVQAAIALVMGVADSSTTEEGAIALVEFIKEIAGACGTFTTPFGEEDGALRTFPFAGEYEIGADCAQAIIDGNVITIGGQKRPICTNLILGVSGASLGIGLGLEATVGSKLIDGSFATSEDATRSGGVEWRKSSNETGSEVDVTFRPDNYDSADFKDDARISLDNFTYYLNALQIALTANLEFGGILDPIPDLGGFTIYNFIVDFDSYGIPIPQHPGTEGIALEIPVENYGLKVDVKPSIVNSPAPDTLLVEPGTFGVYDVSVRNIGSYTGAFDNFRVALSNRPDQTAPYSYDIDRNTDHDCVPLAQSCVRGDTYSRGDPYDGIADGCYDAAGVILSTMRACIDEDSLSAVQGLSRDQRDDDGDGFPDEDPPEQWITSPADFESKRISGVSPYTWSSGAPSLQISVNPFRHPLTRPGIYPIRIKADSEEAKAKSMASTDPSGNARIDARDESFVQVKSFFAPEVVVLPNRDGGKPNMTHNYTIEGTNGGNVADSMSVKIEFLDFNQAGCTLTTLGRLPDCLYRATPTAIPVAWTTAPAVSTILPPAPGTLDPLGSATDAFTISVPRDWAGMDDTTYRFRVTAVSQKDLVSTKNFIAQHNVTATKESMTRYIGLEIADLIATLTAAETSGVKLGGLKPIAVHPIRMMNDSALEAILAGNFAKASNNHATSIQLVKAYVKALDGGGKTLPAALFADLQNRAAAMLADMAAAEISNVSSVP